MLNRRPARGTTPPHVQRWHERLAPQIADARARLADTPPERVAGRAGCARTPDGALEMTALWVRYAIQPPAWTIVRADRGEAPTAFTQALILSYLVTADGTPPSGRWIAYRDLPNGMFYAQAFGGYAEARLARELGADGLARLRTRAAQLGGREIPIGDAGYAFRVLPRVELGLVYWLGDDEFPSRTSVLFDATAPHYMSTDGLAVLGSHLVETLLHGDETG